MGRRVEVETVAGRSHLNGHDASERFRFRLAFVAILVASALFRIAYVLIVKRDDPLWTDEVFYTAQPIEIVNGRGFMNPLVFGEPSAGHAPLTAAALTPVSWMGGSVVLEQRLLMALYGTAVVAGLGWVARLLFDRRTALVATAFAGAYGGLWVNDVMVMSETFAAGSVTLLLAAAYAYRRRSTLVTAGLFGVVIGVGGLARAELLALGGAMGLVMMLATRRDDGSGDRDWPRQFGHLALAAAVSVAVVAPWIIRNQMRFESSTFISTQDGGTLLGANCPAAYDGDFVGFWAYSCVIAVPPLLGEDQSQTEARFREKGLDFIGENLDQIPRVVAFRIGRGMGFYRPGQMTSVNTLDGRAQVSSWILTVQYWLLLVLTVLGLRRWPTAQPRWPIVSTLAFTVLVMAASYGNPRFRVPADVGLVIAGSVPISLWIAKFDAWRRPSSVSSDPPETELGRSTG